MAEVMRGVHVVPPIAGISIVHEADEGIEFLGSPTIGADPVDVQDGSMWLRHRIAESDLEQLRPIVRVNERVTYYDGGTAGPVVRMEGLDPAAPLVTLV